MFTPWEIATDIESAAQPGLLKRAATWPLTGFFSLVLAVFLWPVFGWYVLPIALVFGRLLALDITTYTLPNVYTIPLIVVGMMHALTHEHLGQALVTIFLLVFFNQAVTRSNWSLTRRIGMGGGDFKLLAAFFAFMPLTSAFWAIAIGSLIYLPVAFYKPKAMVPFGVPLILGWVILLRFPGLPNWLFLAIS